MSRASKLLAARLKEVIWRNSPTGRARGRTIQRFADHLGLVYFGIVDKEDQPIRGLTVSTTHRDAHYSVGQFDGYDIALVDRLDVLLDDKRQPIRHDWLIMSIRLHERRHLPHLFINPKGHTAFGHILSLERSLQAMVPQTSWSPDFYLRYDVLTRTEHMIDVETLLSTEVTRMAAAHFWPLAIEVKDDTLYLYASKQHVTTYLLDAMLKNSVWLAQTLDIVPA